MISMRGSKISSQPNPILARLRLVINLGEQ